jgi:exosortase/archaeosortase family protein
MLNKMRDLDGLKNIILRILPLIAFSAALLWLCLLHPQTFEEVWKGRSFQLFFVWLIALEMILGWENMQTTKLSEPTSARTILFVISLMLPIVFVGITNFAGGNSLIQDIAQQYGVQWYWDVPVAVEFFVFAVLFSLTVFLAYGWSGLKSFSVPIFFSAVVGGIFMVDNLYPYGQFTPFQMFVPTTAALASALLGFMGYNSSLNLPSGIMPQLTVIDPANPLNPPVAFSIAWPCAGIESLLIFTVVILLFLKRMPISWKSKIGYFVVGAVVTYFINAFRIVGIYLVALSGGDTDYFHNTIGPLFAIPWIVGYPLIILGIQSLWHRFTNRRKAEAALNKAESNLTTVKG